MIVIWSLWYFNFPYVSCMHCLYLDIDSDKICLVIELIPVKLSIFKPLGLSFEKTFNMFFSYYDVLPQCG